MHLLLQLTNVIEASKVLNNANRGRFIRRALEKDLLFVNYKLADYAIKGRATLAILDNHRLVGDKFMTKEQFIVAKEKEGLDYGDRGSVGRKGKNRKAINKEWQSLRDKSLYNAYDVVDGKLTVKPEFEKHINDNMLAQVTGVVNHVTHQVDGTMSHTDKGKVSRGILGDLLLMHRGWFVNMIDTRVRKESTNAYTGEQEIGMYRASLGFANDLLFKVFKGEIMSFGTSWNKLSASRKRGVKKTVLDMIYLNILAMIAAIFNVAADDDKDDWTTQYAAYQLNRILLEQGAPYSLKEILQIIDEPVVGVRTIKDLVDITEMWNTEKFERGMYADKMHLTKWWLRKTPFKNIYEFQYPDQKNNFIKQIVDSPTYNLMAKDDSKSMSTLDKIIQLFQSEQNYTEDKVDVDELLDTIEILEQENEQEE
jgi:hypothetical protein